MPELALILSPDHAELARLDTCTKSAGFATNCVDDAAVARKLVVAYGADYTTVVIDVDAITREHEGIIESLRLANPDSRVLLSSRSSEGTVLGDSFVTLCASSDVASFLHGA